VTELPGAAWLAVPGFRDDLLSELSANPGTKPHKAAERTAALPPAQAINPAVKRALKGDAKPGDITLLGDLVYREGPAPTAYWHQNALLRPFVAEFASIKEAADILRGIQRNWAHYPVAAFRRAELIRERLPYVNDKPKAFPWRVPTAPMGMWSLLDERTLFASPATSSPFPAGKPNFLEDHENPPSRAYLKMYEALTWADWLFRKSDERLKAGECATGTKSPTAAPKASETPPSGQGSPIHANLEPGADRPDTILPGPGSRCVDAGACPGGWTWVLDLLGANVTAIDRSELAPGLMAKPNIRFMKHDAFTLKPEDFGPTDWVCSDVICYPPRLLEWVEKWLQSGLCANFICTIKMQGAADHETTKRFAEIPGSSIVHLGANKHELTWIRLDPDRP